MAHPWGVRSRPLSACCLPPHAHMHSFMRARLGEHNLRRHDGPEQLIAVSRLIPHPRYEARSHLHDIMLVRLARPARLSRQVRPVALPTQCPHQGEPCVVSGWGLVSNSKPDTPGSPHSQGASKDGAPGQDPMGGGTRTRVNPCVPSPTPL